MHACPKSSSPEHQTATLCSSFQENTDFDLLTTSQQFVILKRRDHRFGWLQASWSKRGFIASVDVRK
jgi:hypothetical protein